MVFGLGWIFTFGTLFLPFYTHMNGFRKGMTLALALFIMGTLAAVQGAVFPKQILITSIVIFLIEAFVKLDITHIILMYITGWFLFQDTKITKFWYL